MKWTVFLLAAVLFVLHQDFWNFDKATPLAFDFMPIGLAYHAAYAFACSFLMFLLVKFAWPTHLEKYEALPPRPGASDGH